MNRTRKKIFLMTLALICAAATSCKSPPEAGRTGGGSGGDATHAGALRVNTPHVNADDVQKARLAAEAARQEALDAKADKAAKDEWGGARDLFAKGEAADAAKNWSAARAAFDEAAEAFREAARQSADKRRIAALAYREAAETRAEVRRKAAETEEAERAAGIETTAGAPTTE